MDTWGFHWTIHLKKETKFEDLLGFFSTMSCLDSKSLKDLSSIFEICWHAEDRPLDLDAYGFTGLEPQRRSKKLVPQKSREFPAIFWDVVGGNGIIFRGLDASIQASRPIWLLWCFDHDQFDDPLDVILQKCGRKCYFFPSGSLWLCRLLIFQKLGGKRWDFHHRGNRMPSAFAVPRPSWTSQRYLWRWYGLNLTDSWTLESDIYQAGGFLGLLGSPQWRSKPWIHGLVDWLCLTLCLKS